MWPSSQLQRMFSSSLYPSPRFPQSSSVRHSPFAWFWGFWLGGIAPLIILTYFVFAEALFARTIGKELIGLRVARLDSKRLDLWSSFVRNRSEEHTSEL